MAHLANPLATVEQLATRAERHGLPPDIFDAVFVATQCLTQAAGVLLEQPQDVIARACVVLARYLVAVPSIDYEYSVCYLLPHEARNYLLTFITDDFSRCDIHHNETER